MYRKVISLLIGAGLLVSCANTPIGAFITTATVTPSLTPTATSTPLPTATLLPTSTSTPLPTETAVPSEIPSPVPEAESDQWMVEATVAPDTAYTYVFPVANAEVHYGKSHHDYPASDIFCDEGSEFVAVIDGVVDFISSEDVWSPKNDNPASRSGIAVAIIGVDGNRYYGSHLSTLAEGITVGQEVSAGQLLGYTGKSGNARYTPPHLHFGISRPTYPDDWRIRRGEMNPFVFLQAWRKGESLAPRFGEE